MYKLMYTVLTSLSKMCCIPYRIKAGVFDLILGCIYKKETSSGRTHEACFSAIHTFVTISAGYFLYYLARNFVCFHYLNVIYVRML
jgi:hypothetical protein